MIVIYWVWKHHRKHHKVYRFVRGAAMIGFWSAWGL